MLLTGMQRHSQDCRFVSKQKFCRTTNLKQTDQEVSILQLHELCLIASAYVEVSVCVRGKKSNYASPCVDTFTSSRPWWCLCVYNLFFTVKEIITLDIWVYVYFSVRVCACVCVCVCLCVCVWQLVEVGQEKGAP